MTRIGFLGVDATVNPIRSSIFLKNVEDQTRVDWVDDAAETSGDLKPLWCRVQTRNVLDQPQDDLIAENSQLVRNPKRIEDWWTSRPEEIEIAGAAIAHPAALAPPALKKLKQSIWSPGFRKQFQIATIAGPIAAAVYFGNEMVDATSTIVACSTGLGSRIGDSAKGTAREWICVKWESQSTETTIYPEWFCSEVRELPENPVLDYERFLQHFDWLPRTTRYICTEADSTQLLIDRCKKRPLEGLVTTDQWAVARGAAKWAANGIGGRKWKLANRIPVSIGTLGRVDHSGEKLAWREIINHPDWVLGIPGSRIHLAVLHGFSKAQSFVPRWMLIPPESKGSELDCHSYFALIRGASVGINTEEHIVEFERTDPASNWSYGIPVVRRQVVH